MKHSIWIALLTGCTFQAHAALDPDAAPDGCFDNVCSTDGPTVSCDGSPSLDGSVPDGQPVDAAAGPPGDVLAVDGAPVDVGLDASTVDGPLACQSHGECGAGQCCVMLGPSGHCTKGIVIGRVCIPQP